MARNPDFLALTPLDHIIAKIHLPYILHFNTTDSKAALNTIENGINKLVAHIPWLAGDVIMRSEPDRPRNKWYIAFSSSSPEATPMLRVKRFDRDEDYDACPTREYLPVPCFIPASQQCPVLRFQANVFPSRIVLVMSFSHFALDGTGSGTILEALAQCCKATGDGYRCDCCGQHCEDRGRSPEGCIIVAIKM